VPGSRCVRATPSAPGHIAEMHIAHHRLHDGVALQQVLPVRAGMARVERDVTATPLCESARDCPDRPGSSAATVYYTGCSPVRSRPRLRPPAGRAAAPPCSAPLARELVCEERRMHDGERGVQLTRHRCRPWDRLSEATRPAWQREERRVDAGNGHASLLDRLAPWLDAPRQVARPQHRFHTVIAGVARQLEAVVQGAVDRRCPTKSSLACCKSIQSMKRPSTGERRQQRR